MALQFTLAAKIIFEELIQVYLNSIKTSGMELHSTLIGLMYCTGQRDRCVLIGITLGQMIERLLMFGAPSISTQVVQT